MLKLVIFKVENNLIINYNKLLTENIFKTYWKTNNKAYDSINKEAKAIAEEFEIWDRVDHKENFRSNPKRRLINPAKSEIGKANKLFIENINAKVRELPSVNQWRDSDAVIKWFKNVKNKSKSIFMQFDIEEFYPSISKDLLLKAIDYTNVLLISAMTKQVPFCTQENLFFLGVQMCG